MARGFSDRLLAARDGRDSVEVLRQHFEDEITCVILDLTMPHMDGVEAFDVMQMMREDMPVIISSGYSEEDFIGCFSGKKPAGVIQKPYTSEDLRVKMKRVLEG